jgi:hypothetical protein
VRLTLLVVAIIVAIIGCSQPPRLIPREPVFPVVASYTSTIVDVRSTLGRALIGVDLAGIDRELLTSPCDDPASPRSSCAHCELADADDAADLAMLDAIRIAVDRYPTRVLEASQIQHVALCRKLYEEPHDTLAGTVDFARHRMLVSLDEFLGKPYDPLRSRTVEDIFHHELFHLLEHEVMYDVITNDAVWRAQNVAGFTYQKPAEGEDRPFGLVNLYASTNDYEDRASVFQLLMARPDDLCAIAKDDPIVRAKTNLLWGRIAIALDDDFLRRRATCVTWLEPAKPPAAAERPAPAQALPWSHARGRGDPPWLAPPVRPRSLR